MKIAIVGGGIGGMALALPLIDVGLSDVEIYESAPAVKALGVGIPTAEWVLYSKHGQRIWREPRGVAAGYHGPQFSIHRGELLSVLHRAVLSRLGATASIRVTISSGSVGARVPRCGGTSSIASRASPLLASRRTCWWGAMGFTPWCATRSTRRKAHPSGTASPCGVASRRASRSSRAGR